MESAQDTAGGAGMVVLHENIRNAALAKSGLTERLCEEPPGVPVPHLLDQDESGSSSSMKRNDMGRNLAPGRIQHQPSSWPTTPPAGVHDLPDHVGVYRCSTPTMLELRETEAMDYLDTVSS